MVDGTVLIFLYWLSLLDRLQQMEAWMHKKCEGEKEARTSRWRRECGQNVRVRKRCVEICGRCQGYARSTTFTKSFSQTAGDRAHMHA
jgi:hypothetical protein